MVFEYITKMLYYPFSNFTIITPYKYKNIKYKIEKWV